MAQRVRLRHAAPSQGVVTSLPSDLLTVGQSPRVQNVRGRYGEIRRGPGRSTLAAAVVAESALNIGRFPVVDGTVWAWMLTATKLYRWGNTAPGNPRAWSGSTGTALTGTSRWGTAVGEGRLFFARAGNTIQRWPSGVSAPSAGTYETIPASAGTVPKARFLAYFNNRLHAGFTTEGATDYGNRIRYSANGNHTDWDSTAGTGAGFIDLYEVDEEPIRGMAVLSGRLVVYRQHSITDLIPTGQLSPTYTVETRSAGRGIGAPYTLAGNGLVHFFLGTDANVYAWDGVRMTPVGEPILKTLQMTATAAGMDSYFGAVIPSRQEYWLVLGPSSVYVYDYARDSWHKDTFADITALAEVEDTFSAETWATVATTWASETRAWEAMDGTRDTAVWYGTSASATRALSDAVASDVDGSFESYAETHDVFLARTQDMPEGDPSTMATLLRVLIAYEATGTDAVEMGVSLDRGQTWNTQQFTPNTAGYSLIDWNLTSNVFRLRIRETGTSSTFRWRWHEWEVVDAGPYNGTR